MTDPLEQLSQRVKSDLAMLSYPARPWVAPRSTRSGAPILDVLIVGGGQGGLAAAFGLLRERVTNLLVVDENPLDRAGPWLNFARMRTLRTPKYLTGPDLGIPSLTPRAWYEAQSGEGSWERLGLLPKELWASYLSWYRRTLEIPVRAQTRVGALRWNAAEAAFEVPCRAVHGGHAAAGAATADPSGGAGEPASELLYARRVVLATGIDGSGAWEIPDIIRDNLPPRLYAHTRADIDFGALRGKRVGLLGAGASAFDNAATALEQGAREAHLFFRRSQLVQVNPYRWAEFVGFLKHFGELPDPDKWRFITQILRMGQLPPADTFRRATELPGCQLHPNSRFKQVSQRGDIISIVTEQGTTHELDYLIVATGFLTDLSVREELSHLHPLIARWQDRYVPPAEQAHQDMARHPYLGPAFEFTEREAGSAPYLRYLYNYTFGCLLSLGFGGASISGMKYSIPRLVGGITASLFLEDREAHFQSLCEFEQREF
jgi:cation diffusion facilitator CzcD-associated flavoprotein CzcO